VAAEDRGLAAGRLDAFCSGVEVSFSEPAMHGDGEAFFRIRLPPRSDWTVHAAVRLLGADVEAPVPEPIAELTAAVDRAS